MKVFNWFKRVFLLGMVAILPIYVTIRVVVAVFLYLDKSMAPLIQAHLPVTIPGLGVLVTLAVILLAGFLMQFVLFRRLGERTEAFIDTIPLVRTVYAAVKQVVEPLLGHGGHDAFKQVVTFDWPGDGIRAMGFVVRDDFPPDARTPEDELLVFLPTNHLHLGFVLGIPRGKLHAVDISIEDAIRTQFSLGVAAAPVRFSPGGPPVLRVVANGEPPAGDGR